MTQYLPPNLLALFAPRDPMPYMPPTDKLPHEKKQDTYIGVAQFLNHFEDPKDTPPPTRVETKDERKERKRKERAEQVAYKLEQDLALWDPNTDPNAGGDPYKTMFVARINYDTSESKLRREFEVYGPVKRINLVVNKKTGKPRGYAFVEYEHERDMHSAYKHADGKKIDGRRVLVDIERGRTIKGWRARRLGGGLGGTRKGGPDQNTKYSGRDDPSRDARDARSPFGDRGVRSTSREPVRRRSRSRDRGRKRRSRSPRDRKRRSRSRERRGRPDRGAAGERGGERPDRDQEEEEGGRSKRPRRRSGSRDRKRSRSRDRKRSRRSRSRDRKRSRSRDRRDRGHPEDGRSRDGSIPVKEEDPNAYSGYPEITAEIGDFKQEPEYGEGEYREALRAGGGDANGYNNGEGREQEGEGEGSEEGQTFEDGEQREEFRTKIEEFPGQPEDFRLKTEEDEFQGGGSAMEEEGEQ